MLSLAGGSGFAALSVTGGVGRPGPRFWDLGKLEAGRASFGDSFSASENSHFSRSCFAF